MEEVPAVASPKKGRSVRRPCTVAHVWQKAAGGRKKEIPRYDVDQLEPGIALEALQRCEAIGRRAAAAVLGQPLVCAPCTVRVSCAD